MGKLLTSMRWLSGLGLMLILNSPGAGVQDLVSRSACLSDDLPPQVSITDPENGDLVGGSIEVRVDALDNVGIEKVIVYKDADPVGVDREVPYSASIDFDSAEPGKFYLIKAEAYDPTGNRAEALVRVKKPGASLAPIGARGIANGAFFKVWAPHAEVVRLLQQKGKEWQTDEAGFPTACQRLDRAAGGYWFGFAPGTGAGHLYRFRLTNAETGESFERLDPAARDTIHSWPDLQNIDNKNAGIVVTGEKYRWAPFKTPQFHNFIIYQLHVGSFAGRNDEFNKEIATFRDIESKLDYIRDLGFNAIEFLPIQEFRGDRSWGYNPAFFFAPESSYGAPQDLKHLVNEAHKMGLAVIFDVVFNHVDSADNPLWNFDGDTDDGGIYFEGGWDTEWGKGPAWWKEEVQDFFFQNVRMYFDDYHADGLRFDATTRLDGTKLKEILWELQELYPEKYMIAEHLPADPWVTTVGNFDATWYARSHHEFQRAMAGEDPVAKVKKILGWNGFRASWNLVKYTLGSHDDIGDQEAGDAENGMDSWDSRHRYFVDLFGGRDNRSARAKTRLGWALNAAMPGTPMLFMGSECYMGAPTVAWGYWHDGRDVRGDHRFDWAVAGDALGMQMRRLVAKANALRWGNPALRSDRLQITHEDDTNHVIAFKRWSAGGNVVLAVVNMGETNFRNHSYGVGTGGQTGQWTQILCTQDPEYGGWDGAGNAYHEPWTRSDGRIYINLPKWSVILMRQKL